jgi:putative CocE/NonD family hydrolase
MSNILRLNRQGVARLCVVGVLLILMMGLVALAPARAQSLASDIPQAFLPVTTNHDYSRREVDIPMRDGVKLHTVLIIPRGSPRAPILLDRTPFGADSAADVDRSSHADRIVVAAYGAFLRAGYIVAFQDIRGKHGSEGVYVYERPLRGPDNPTEVDHSTDAWDSIDWLVKNVSESNGRVGMIGTSYGGMMVAMALTHPHPALKVAVSANPAINTWLGDDDFHNGALRIVNFDYYFGQHSSAGDAGQLWRGKYDDYETFLEAGSAGDFARKWGLDQLPAVRRLREHPSYDAYWRAQALEEILRQHPPAVPTIWVASQWDAEDIYGAFAAFQAVHAHDPQGAHHLVIGPWPHEGWMFDGSSLGSIPFDSNTALYFRTEVLLPFLDAHLRDGPASDLPPVLAFQTGTNRWQRLSTWPQSCSAGCPSKPSRLYLLGDGGAGFTAPVSGSAEDTYTSDPAKPVPYRVRPIRPYGAPQSSWARWLVDDQRPFSDRTDVLVYRTPPLTEPVTIAGAAAVNLVAATTGTDGDFVVKLIDVYPDEYAEKPELGGYQLGIAMDILRGRYREGFHEPAALVPGQPLTYRFSLPNANHVFLPGHRIMVQIQSSWFPLYDRNPQTFVPNIFDARAQDYRAATIRIFHTRELASFLELPVVAAPTTTKARLR